MVDNPTEAKNVARRAAGTSDAQILQESRKLNRAGTERTFGGMPSIKWNGANITRTCSATLTPREPVNAVPAIGRKYVNELSRAK